MHFSPSACFNESLATTFSLRLISCSSIFPGHGRRKEKGTTPSFFPSLTIRALIHRPWHHLRMYLRCSCCLRECTSLAHCPPVPLRRGRIIIPSHLIFFMPQRKRLYTETKQESEWEGRGFFFIQQVKRSQSPVNLLSSGSAPLPSRGTRSRTFCIGSRAKKRARAREAAQGRSFYLREEYARSTPLLLTCEGKREYKKRPLFRTASELKVCNADLWRFSNSNYNRTSRLLGRRLGTFDCAEQIHAYFLYSARDVWRRSFNDRI